jgi:glyoxylase-like metal-dependent hydrolase (beta-lactamase superfamily II)
VRIAGTVAEGDGVAGFEVVHLPGHAPGQIALLRRADGVALTTDVFYSLDDWGRDSPPHVPGDYYNLDTEQARASLRRLAALEVAVAWPGHGEPLRGDVRSQLLAAADADA